MKHWCSKRDNNLREVSLHAVTESLLRVRLPFSSRVAQDATLPENDTLGTLCLVRGSVFDCPHSGGNRCPVLLHLLNIAHTSYYAATHTCEWGWRRLNILFFFVAFLKVLSSLSKTWLLSYRINTSDILPSNKYYDRANSCNRVQLESSTFPYLVNIFCAFCVNVTSFTMFTIARSWILCWGIWFPSLFLDSLALRPILILYNVLGVASSVFQWSFLTNILYLRLNTPMRATRPAHLFQFDSVKLFHKEYDILKVSIFNLFHHP